MKKKIRFRKDIYGLPAIKTAISDFREVGGVRIEEKGEYIEIEITPKEDCKDIEYEFSNYVLGIMKQDG